jgi:hypothetical protein
VEGAWNKQPKPMVEVEFLGLGKNLCGLKTRRKIIGTIYKNRKSMVQNDCGHKVIADKK